MFRPRPPSAECLSNLALDRLLVEELDEGGRAAATGHVAGCQRCAERLRELRAERDRFPAEARPLVLPARRVPPSGRAVRAIFAGGAVAVAAVAIFLVVRAWDGDAGGPSPAQGNTGRHKAIADATRVKGGLRLGLYIKRHDAVVEGRGGDIVHPGDAIRFAYTSTSAGYLMILSRDGAGRVSVYFPGGDRAAPIDPAEDEVLPGSIVLDGVLGREEITALLCDEPVATARAVAALRAAGGTDQIAGCAAERLVLDKRP